jgi:hypothetical protein
LISAVNEDVANENTIDTNVAVSRFYESKQPPQPSFSAQSLELIRVEPLIQLQPVDEVQITESVATPDVAQEKPALEDDWRLHRVAEKVEKDEIITPYRDNAVFYLTAFLQENPDSPKAVPLVEACAHKLISIAEKQHSTGEDFAARNTLEEVFAFDAANETAQSLWKKWQGTAWRG